MTCHQRDHDQEWSADAQDTFRVARSANREIAHLLFGIAAQAERLARQLSPGTLDEFAEGLSVIEAQAWRGFAAADRAEDRFRCLVGPEPGHSSRGAAS